MNWGKVGGKFFGAALVAIGVIVCGALLQGLTNFKPQPGTEAMLWNFGGAALIGLVTAALNWLKHRQDSPN